MWSGKEKQRARFRAIIEVLFCSIRYVLVHPQNICHLRIRIFAEQIKWTIISCRPIKFLFLIQYVLFACLCFVFLFSFVCFFFPKQRFLFAISSYLLLYAYFHLRASRWRRIVSVSCQHSVCKEAIKTCRFENLPISRIWGLSSCRFLHKTNLRQITLRFNLFEIHLQNWQNVQEWPCLPLLKIFPFPADVRLEISDTLFFPIPGTPLPITLNSSYQIISVVIKIVRKRKLSDP